MAAEENRFAAELTADEVIKLLKMQHQATQRKPQSMV